ncbi:MAG: DNA repair protein RecO [Clostridiales bacterium]|nr:DNA repair protein RecO [Clostridiales bacterium]
MDVTTKALVLRATDYKENDKFVLLYSLEYGKITVHAKGIRKANAKLKFAADQFCFGQYELAKVDDRFTLKTCDQLESFYSLREDVVVYYSACTIAECLANYTEEGQSEPNVFVETLKALQALTNGIEPLSVALRFLLAFMEMQGFKLQLNGCLECGKSSKKLYLDLQRGGMLCETCRNPDSSPVSPRVLAACQMLDGMPYDKLQNLNFTVEMLKDALELCYKYVSHSFFPLKSLSELVKLA